ncbi:hypothetical protein N8I77_002696 [Diaporthe amygdali]|uniref:Xylanolytic transcriptional activator regulatory domain-containing protein n=1 Tax=Phomopsis amygdali TaxID=1214568 RepID=A0AAD9W9I4_PHOAM|nr:hypothetical protein N8I77_002696 [Diaporthe amygdali]
MRASDSLDDTLSEISSRDNTSVKSDSKLVDLWYAISRITINSDDGYDDENEDSGATSSEKVGHGGVRDHVQQSERSVHSSVTKNAWDRNDTYQNDRFNDDDHLLFGVPKLHLRLSTLHPEQVQILRLWQIYLENIDPLLKVTHTPTLQARIISAVGDLASICPTLESLMFSVYCVAIMSLTDEQCRSFFASPRKELLVCYQSACQQSLLNCGALRSGNVESLTALYLYLVSVRPQTDPRSLSSTLAVAIRTAQKLGINDEATYSNCTAFDAEMRRRLWWSLVTFDHRLCEMTEYKTTSLTPIWHCKKPLNVNDFELRPEMKSSPPIHENPTEALFVFVRSELADFVRHTAFHINFINPCLNVIAKPRHGPAPDGEELTFLETEIEYKYINSCDPEIPLHFMTIWTTRAYLARLRLLENYSRLSTSSAQQTESQRSDAVSHALRMLECETKLRTSPLTKRFLWHVDSNVPALAYMHILNVLEKRPDEEHAERAWEILSDNYEARATNCKPGEYGISNVFSRVVLQVWAARETLCEQQGRPIQLPRIVSMVRNMAKVQDLSSSTQKVDHGRPGLDHMGIASGGSQVPVTLPVSFDGHGPQGQFLSDPGLGSYLEIPGQATKDIGMNHLLNPMDWRWMHPQGW